MDASKLQNPSQNEQEIVVKIDFTTYPIAEDKEPSESASEASDLDFNDVPQMEPIDLNLPPISKTNARGGLQTRHKSGGKGGWKRPTKYEARKSERGRGHDTMRPRR